MIRSHARSPKGQRAHCENSLTRGTRVSTIAFPVCVTTTTPPDQPPLNPLLVDELLAALKSIDKGSDLTLSNLERAANLVTSFKRTAVDQTSDKMR